MLSLATYYNSVMNPCTQNEANVRCFDTPVARNLYRSINNEQGKILFVGCCSFIFFVLSTASFFSFTNYQTHFEYISGQFAIIIQGGRFACNTFLRISGFYCPSVHW